MKAKKEGSKELSHVGKSQVSLAPEVIAQLAAILSLRSSSDPKMSHEANEHIDAAISLYLSTQLRCNELSGLSLAQVAIELRDSTQDSSLLWKIADAKHRARVQRLRLYPDVSGADNIGRQGFDKEGFDDVRRYLHENSGATHYLSCKRSDKVLESIQLMFLDRADQFNRSRQGEILQKKVVRMDGRKTYEDFLVRRAVYKDNTEDVLEQYIFLDEPLKQRELLCWELEVSFLEELLKWRVGLKKHRGGIRGLKERLIRKRKASA